MKSLQHFGKLIFFQTAPHELPYEPKLLLSLGCIYTGIIALVSANIAPTSLSYSIFFLAMAKEFLFLIALYKALEFFKYQKRFVQSACNFLAVTVIQAFLAKILLKLFPAQNLQLLLVIWFFAINTYLTRACFGVSNIKGVLIYFLLGMPANILPLLVLVLINPNFLEQLKLIQ